jgi:uncharacterized RDD family membrane protein YckC
MDPSHPIKRIAATALDVALLQYAISPTVELLLRPYAPREEWTGEMWQLFNLHALVMGTIWILYFVLMETAPWGATFGKLALGIRVVGDNGERITVFRSLGRNLAKCLMLPTVGAEFLLVFFTRSRQSLHDILSSSHVITERPMF